MTPFNITHVKAFTSAEGAILVSYIRKVSAHFAMHLSLLVIQPHKLWKPLFFKFMSIHLCLLFIFSLWHWLFLFCSFLSVCTLNFIVSAWKNQNEKGLWLLIDDRLLKMADYISHPQTYLLLHHPSCTQSSYARSTCADFLDILAFRNGVVLVYLFIYLFITIYFFLAVLTPETTFQTVENHLIGRYLGLILWFFYFPLNLFYSPMVNG